jgi:hypothetical protein
MRTPLVKKQKSPRLKRNDFQKSRDRRVVQLSCTDHFEVGAREIDGTFPGFASREGGPSRLDCKLLTRLIEVGKAVAIQDGHSQLIEIRRLE